MPEVRTNVSAESGIFHLTTHNSGKYVMPEGHNADAALYRDADSYILSLKH
jgi:hypothetical protein